MNDIVLIVWHEGGFNIYRGIVSEVACAKVEQMSKVDWSGHVLRAWMRVNDVKPFSCNEIKMSATAKTRIFVFQ